MALVKGIAHFHYYLYGQKFLAKTDHAILRWLLNFRSPEGQIARWLEKLQEYDLELNTAQVDATGTLTRCRVVLVLMLIAPTVYAWNRKMKPRSGE